MVDHLDREINDREFPATAAGYAALAGWLHSLGELARVEVEGTSSYDAGLARHLRQVGCQWCRFNRPDRPATRRASRTRLMPMPRPGPP